MLSTARLGLAAISLLLLVDHSPYLASSDVSAVPPRPGVYAGSLKPWVHDLVALYLQSAFLAFPAPATNPDHEYLFKRDEDQLVSVVPSMKSDDYDSRFVDMIAQVSDDLQRHSAGIKLNPIGRDQIVSFVRRAKSQGDPSLENAVLAILGSRATLEEIVGKYSLSPELMRDYRAEFDAARPICMVVLSPRPPRPEAQTDFSPVGMATLLIEHGPGIETCLYRALMHSFGIGGELPLGTASIFSDPARYPKPTNLDWDLWRIQTDPRIEAGMTRQQAADAATAIVNGWQR